MAHSLAQPTMLDETLGEGHSTNRPPLFKGMHYNYWKTRMAIYIEGMDIELWEMVNTRYEIPMKVVDGIAVRKSFVELSDVEKRCAQLNAKALSHLHCSLAPSEFNRICTLKTAHEVWSRLEVTYEGTSQVKESKINMLMHDYELFEMLQYETIKDMFTRFTNITNALISLGKVFSNEELVRKILRCLPKEYDAKSTAITEAQNLSVLLLDDLMGKLVTYEQEFQRRKKNEDEGKYKKKALALKATPPPPSSSDDETLQEDMENELDQEIAMVSRRMGSLMKKKCYFGKPFQKNFGKNKYSSKSPSTEIVCFECKKPGHFKLQCPQLKKEYKGKKKAMVATWSDSDASSTSEDEQKKETANLCFMAHEVAHTPQPTDEVNDDEEILTYAEIENALVDLHNEFNKLKTKYYKLIKEHSTCEVYQVELASKIETLIEEKKSILDKLCEHIVENTTLKHEKARVECKVNNHAHFSHTTHAHHAHNYHHNNMNSMPHVQCYHCGRNGHYAHSCMMKNRSFTAHQRCIWKPISVIKKSAPIFANVYGPKQVWVPIVKT